jgi:peptidoglycan hydrolase-like protein with peptidoglycan-binding domain
MKKYMPYIIFGVPALIGVLFLVKAIRNKREDVEDNNQDDNKDNKTDPDKKSGGGSTTTPKKDFPLRRGSKGDLVKTLQAKLGFSGKDVDGDFGRKTEAKVKEFQKANGLTADGIVGAKTWKALFGADYPSTGTNLPKSMNPNASPNPFSQYQSWGLNQSMVASSDNTRVK